MECSEARSLECLVAIQANDIDNKTTENLFIVHHTQEEKTDTNKEIVPENVEVMDASYSGEVHKSVELEPQGLIDLEYIVTLANKNTNQEDETHEIGIDIATLPSGTLSNELIEMAVRKGPNKRPDNFLEMAKELFPCVS